MTRIVWRLAPLLNRLGFSVLIAMDTAETDCTCDEPCGWVHRVATQRHWSVYR